MKPHNDGAPGRRQIIPMDPVRERHDQNDGYDFNCKDE